MYVASVAYDTRNGHLCRRPFPLSIWNNFFVLFAVPMWELLKQYQVRAYCALYVVHANMNGVQVQYRTI